jgi:hypothetical protein
MGGKLQELCVERLTAFWIEGREEFVFDLFDDSSQAEQLPFPGGGDADDVAAPVVGVSLSGDQAACLEGVE